MACTEAYKEHIMYARSSIFSIQNLFTTKQYNMT